jgi:3-oxoacyl-[acyl-carrier protein] reductase
MKNIIVTGESRGLGKSICKTLRKNNFNVIGISRTSSQIQFDFNKSDEIKRLYFDQIKNLGPIHGFVNNAAIAYDDIITNLNHEMLLQMYRVNVLSPMMLTKYVLRDMILNKTKGSIVHVSSISVHTGYKGLAMYASTKGSLEAFSKNTARGWGKLGIRSNVISPGFMDTDMSSGLSDEQRNKIFKRNSKQKELLVDEVSSVVNFLLGKKSEGITGQNIHVDNGTI